MIFNFDIGVYFKSIKTEDMNSHVVVTVVDRHVTRLRAHSSTKTLVLVVFASEKA